MLSPGLIPGTKPPYFVKLSAVSVGLKVIAVSKKVENIIPDAYNSI